MDMSNEKKGPVAPKDPTAKRDYFYIMHGLEIYGSPQPDGRGIQFIHENGRFAECVRRVGNVTDEEMLELLPTTAGFRRIVHSIGVSVSELKSVPVRFCLQMFPVSPGLDSTTVCMDMIADGSERIIELSDIDWRDTDDIIGQIRFEFDEPEHQAVADVRLYLNDGYSAPEQSFDTDVDFESDAYRSMIEKSLVSCGGYPAVNGVIDKARRGEIVTLAFIGGSVTQGAGAVPIHKNAYARQFADAFADRYCGGNRDNVRLIKAGVGGTPSELGMIRFTRDVLRDGSETPDLIVIEFAVNDAGDETGGDCYESLVRKALRLSWHPAVILLFAVFSDDYTLQDRLMPIGDHYGLPMVSLKNAVSQQFVLLPGAGRVMSKNQYFYDLFHPSNIGHRVMSDCLMNLLERSEASLPGYAEDKWASFAEDGLRKPPCRSGRFEAVELLDKESCVIGQASWTEGAFNSTDQEVQRVEMDSELAPVPEFPYNWHYDGSRDAPESFVLKVRCKRILGVFKDSDSPEFGCAVCFVDGSQVLEYDPLEIGWTHCNAVIIADGDRTEDHTVEIRMAPGFEHRKFTILGFGLVE